MHKRVSWRQTYIDETRAENYQNSIFDIAQKSGIRRLLFSPADSTHIVVETNSLVPEVKMLRISGATVFEKRFEDSGPIAGMMFNDPRRNLERPQNQLLILTEKLLHTVDIEKGKVSSAFPYKRNVNEIEGMKFTGINVFNNEIVLSSDFYLFDDLSYSYLSFFPRHSEAIESDTTMLCVRDAVITDFSLRPNGELVVIAGNGGVCFKKEEPEGEAERETEFKIQHDKDYHTALITQFKHMMYEMDQCMRTLVQIGESSRYLVTSDCYDLGFWDVSMDRDQAYQRKVRRRFQVDVPDCGDRLNAISCRPVFWNNAYYFSTDSGRLFRWLPTKDFDKTFNENQVLEPIGFHKNKSNQDQTGEPVYIIQPIDNEHLITIGPSVVRSWQLDDARRHLLEQNSAIQADVG